MGDLNREQALQTVTLFGTDSVGNPTNAVGSDANLNLKVVDYSTSATGSAVPSAASFIAGRNPTGNLQALATDASGRLQSALYDAAGNALSSTSGALNVSAVQSGTWTTGRTWTLSSGTDSVATITQAAVTTAAPTYTTGTNNSLSLNTAGGLRIDGSGVTQPISAAALPLPSGASTETTLAALNAKVTAVNSQIQVRDTINTAGQNRAQSVTTTAAEALGAATILVNRKLLVITPTNGTVYWGYTNAVTTSSGTPIFKNMPAVFAITDNVHIYLISAGTVDCRIAEAS